MGSFRLLSLLLAGSYFLCCPLAAEEGHRPWLAKNEQKSDPAARIATRIGEGQESIRVRLLHTRSAIRLHATGPFEYMPLSGGKVQSAQRPLVVRRTKKGLQVGNITYHGSVLVSPSQPSDFLILNGRRFRGALLFQPLKNRWVDVIEQVGMEDYLKGVLPREVGTDWPLEALKAQAVVSRTYVMANRATDPAQRFDVYSNVSSQVYGGFEDEAPSSTQAVEDTKGEILLDNRQQPVQTFFHSSCGGITETPQHVWASQEIADDFASIRDDFCQEDPFYHWTLSLSAGSVRLRLRRAGIRVGEIKKIQVAQKSPSGRAESFLVISSTGKRKILGNRFRIALGPEALRSTLLTDLRRTKRGFVFEGRGWGHGVGLCQWGARGRALAGQTYQQIVEAYYPRSTLTQVVP